MTSATEELRRMLDERGVEWRANDTYRLLVTSLNDASGHSWAFMEHRDGSFSKLTAYRLTPEQAIAATLGAGTCKVESSVGIEFNTLISPDYFEFEMSCGSRFSWSDNEPPDYCPGCGRKVVNGGS